MSLFPENEELTVEDIEELSEELITERLPSKTYYFDIETGEIRRMIDGKEAIIQFVWKAILTTRSKHIIYSDDYGCELQNFIGLSNTSADFIEAEMRRTITEALIYDERIESVIDITITSDFDGYYISCTVETVEGTIEVNEVIR